MAATATSPAEAVRLLKRVIPATFKRFWIEAGTPTPQTPETTDFSKERLRISTETKVFLRFLYFLSDYMIPGLIFYVVGFGLLMKKDIYTKH